MKETQSLPKTTKGSRKGSIDLPLGRNVTYSTYGLLCVCVKRKPLSTVRTEPVTIQLQSKHGIY